MSEHHGEGLTLSSEEKGILKRGILFTVKEAEHLSFSSFPSQRFPLPITRGVYGEPPAPNIVIQQIRDRIEESPVSILEQFLVLLELIESNNHDTALFTIDDDEFLRVCFRTKRNNGWAFPLGVDNSPDVIAQVNARWNFEFFYTSDITPGDDSQQNRGFLIPQRPGGAYYFINMLFRYAFIYGRKKEKDAHGIGHFIEDFAPGVLICGKNMTDVNWTIALSLMKLGVPALVPEEYPFRLGRTIQYKSEQDIVDGIVQFPNIHRLLDLPGLTRLPDYCNPQYKNEEFSTVKTFGDTIHSYFFMEPETPGSGIEAGIEINGVPESGMGIRITAEHPRLKEMDCLYIESKAYPHLSEIKGIRAVKKKGALVISVGNGASLEPKKIGEVLLKAIKKEFPKLEFIHVVLEFREEVLSARAQEIKEKIKARKERVNSISEDSIPEFYYCIGCSPFAPDHVCILTPDRTPQCRRPFMAIRTGALFNYDDMSSIHHRVLHETLNSYGVLEKGECLNPEKGEWTGINEYARSLTDGRTPKVFLHTLFDHPTTGCGCFGIIAFYMPEVDGIGIMHREFEGAAPDGRTWMDLKYDLAGKQTSGISGCGPGYLLSPKFLQGDGGWDRVVWVTEKIKRMVSRHLPEGKSLPTEKEVSTLEELRRTVVR
jgi:hypothetical protein